MPAWFKKSRGFCCCFTKYCGLVKSMSELRGWKQCSSKQQANLWMQSSNNSLSAELMDIRNFISLKAFCGTYL